MTDCCPCRCRCCRCLCVRVACRGRRHVLGLPVNGQNASGNAKTARKFKRHIMYDVK